MARLFCLLSEADPGAPVQWLKEGVELHVGPKYEIRCQGAMCELLIHGLEAKDAGEYACVVGGQKTLASLRVKGESAGFPERRVSPPFHIHSLRAPLGHTWLYQLKLTGRPSPPQLQISSYSFLYHFYANPSRERPLCLLYPSCRWGGGPA